MRDIKITEKKPTLLDTEYKLFQLNGGNITGAELDSVNCLREDSRVSI